MGRPPKPTSHNAKQLKQAKMQRRQDYRERIPIEGKFGQGKQGYQLNRIKAKTARTSEAWIRSLFLVMNLLIPYQIFYVWRKFVSYSIHDGAGWMRKTIKQSVLKLAAVIQSNSAISF